MVLRERLRGAFFPLRGGQGAAGKLFLVIMCVARSVARLSIKDFPNIMIMEPMTPQPTGPLSLFNLQTKSWPPCFADFLDSMPIACWPNTGENAGNLWAFFLRSLQSWLHTTHLCFKSDQTSSHLADCSLGGYPTRVYSHTKFIPMRNFSRGAPRC